MRQIFLTNKNIVIAKEITTGYPITGTVSQSCTSHNAVATIADQMFCKANDISKLLPFFIFFKIIALRYTFVNRLCLIYTGSTQDRHIANKMEVNIDNGKICKN